MKDLKTKLCEIENGRFANIINVLDVRDICEVCYYFNPSIKNIGKGYKCYCMNSCIAATLHPDLQKYLWIKLGWIND